MKKIKGIIKKEGSMIRKEFQEKTLGYILTALGLVAGLSWNDFIKSFIETAFPVENNSNGILAKLIYATITTLIVVIVSAYLLKLFAKNEDEKE